MLPTCDNLQAGEVGRAETYVPAVGEEKVLARYEHCGEEVGRKSSRYFSGRETNWHGGEQCLSVWKL